MSYNLLAISGSKRKGSYNTALVNAFKTLAPEGVTVEIADLSAIPLYDQDDEAAFPAEVAALKEKIAAADGIIVSTPEYNRSIPGYLKNTIDWTSRPYSQGAWSGKPVFVIGASMAPTGAALAQYDLKKTMLFMNAIVMGQPEFYSGLAQTKFDGEGNLTDEDTKSHIASGLSAFTAFIDKVK
jgi:chromate reductase